jgi:membrane associated rhomboid family serine protease
MDWRADDFFPKARGLWQFWRPPFGRKVTGEAGVKRGIWQWHPWDPILVSTPESRHFLPPICIPEIADGVHKRMLLQYKVLLLVAAAFTAAALASYMSTKTALFGRMAASGSLIIFVITTQYIFLFKHIDNLRDMSRYVAWVYMQKNKLLIFSMAAMVAIGVFQWSAEKDLGGFEPFILKYGLVFAEAKDQPWRYLAGPFFHSSVAHWAGNAALLVVALGLAVPLGRRYAIATVFLLGVLLPPLALSLLPPALRAEAFGGISGGIFATLGWVGGYALRNKDWLPPHLGWIVVTFSVLFAGLSWLMNPQTSSFVHLLGFAFGLGLGAVNLGSRIVCSKIRHRNT